MNDQDAKDLLRMLNQIVAQVINLEKRIERMQAKRTAAPNDLPAALDRVAPKMLHRKHRKD